MYTAMEVDAETIADTESVERNCYCRGTLKRCGNISTSEEKRPLLKYNQEKTYGE